MQHKRLPFAFFYKRIQRQCFPQRMPSSFILFFEKNAISCAFSCQPSEPRLGFSPLVRICIIPIV